MAAESFLDETKVANWMIRVGIAETKRRRVLEIPFPSSNPSEGASTKTIQPALGTNAPGSGEDAPGASSEPGRKRKRGKS